MLFAAKSAIPCVAKGIFRDQVSDTAAKRSTIFTAPSGYLLTESLAAAIREQERPILWLRLGPEDRDPATFLLSLISASQRLNPNLGKAVLEEMRRKPGPVYGWSPIFTLLANELRDTLPTGTAIVLENIHLLDPAQPVLGLLLTQILPQLHVSNIFVLVTNNRLPSGLLPDKTTLRDVSDLRLDIHSAQTITEHSNLELSPECIRKIVRLTGGRAEALVSIHKGCNLIGIFLTQHIVSKSRNMDELLDQLASSCLNAVDESTLQAASLITHLSYSHPDINRSILGNDSTPSGPWLQSLQDDWSHLLPVWQAPLQRALRITSGVNYDNLLSAADYLSEQCSLEQAIQIYINLGCMNRAAENINKNVQSMMSIGQWKTLDDWLNQLPELVLYQYPWLIYVRGEIAISGGNFEKAYQSFSKATELFSYKNENIGACLSLLAEGALAARQGDHDRAWSKAIAVGSKAEKAGLTLFHGWALWQLGCLATRDGEIEAALAHFNQASTIAKNIHDPHLLQCVERVEALTTQLHELQTQRLIKKQEYLAIQKAESELAACLGQTIDKPQENLAEISQKYGWLQTPLMFKLDIRSPITLPPISTNPTRFWDKLVSVLGLNRFSAFAEDAEPIESDLFSEMAPFAYAGTNPSHTVTQSSTDPAAARDSPTSRVATVDGVRTQYMPPAPLPGDSINHLQVRGESKSPVLTITAYLLGAFRIALNDKPINCLPVGKGRSIFKYIIFNHDQPILRDVLMDVFWPEVDPESARNSLNVALYTVREALRSTTDIPVIIFDDGAYVLNPDIAIWIDVEEFDHQLKFARKYETENHLDIARKKLETAANLYQGDFMADDPYEEWAILTRERLRVSYLDILDRLSRIYYQNGQYTACAALCQLILERDNCREDAHCLLMRSYARQNQFHLAIRQYQVCVENLREELDIDPALETVRLYERLRRREHTQPLNMS